MKINNYNSAPSLAWKLNRRWMLRLFFTFISIDIALLILFSAGTLMYSEHIIAETLKSGNISPMVQLQEVVSFDGFDRNSIWHLNIFLPEETKNGRRNIYIPETGKNRWDSLDYAVYKVCLQKNDKYVVISYNIGDYFKIFKFVFLILFLWELLYWIFSIKKGLKSAKKVLQPLSVMSDAAERLGGKTGKDESSFAYLAGKISNIDVHKLDARISVEECQKELQGIAGAINKMLDNVENAYRRQNAFVSDASHELRTPVSVIQGYANLLNRWGKNDEKTLQESIDAIRIESERMGVLIESLLFLAKSDNDSLIVNFTDVEVVSLINEVYKEAEMIDDNHNWSKKIDITNGTCLIKADIALIKQAIRILTDNACHYTPKNGEIQISAKEIAGRVYISVQDSGIGIPAADIPYIFDRFYRSDPSRERRKNGSGLGLSIAGRIVEKHGGEWEILSREGLGTRMTISFKTNPC